MKNLLALLLLALASCTATRPQPQAWRGFGAPAYLPPATTRRPSQAVLDARARAARPGAHALTTTK
jgi:hypothetical protein